MSDEEAGAAIARITEEYVAERVGAGEDPEVARATARAQHDQLFRDGRPAEGQHLMHVLDGDERVGLLWMGRPLGGGGNAGADGVWHVYLVEVEETRRGRGYGRAAMEAAEAWTRERGGTRVALNVFGPNLVARSLYDALGYEVMATAMYKDLD